MFLGYKAVLVSFRCYSLRSAFFDVRKICFSFFSLLLAKSNEVQMGPNSFSFFSLLPFEGSVAKSPVNVLVSFRCYTVQVKFPNGTV